MPIEIERKFIADKEKLPAAKKSTRLEQGYIDRDKATVRVRVSGDECFLTIKGAVSGKSRLEYEYAIPLNEGRELIQLLCGKPVIEKTRHLIDHGGHTWEVDVFDGENAGLVVAEVELDAEDERVDLPDWVSREVTSERKYSNASLAEKPFSAWTEEERAGS
ncbi:CYTH domain-containing protein [Cerasicoccus fimbriatus]|uniref:CYTH domain-containing protein n=1 Tax=Cerasicoccus fimbriatus TaxID=3014554 RepID=UPI0022B43848|nr:CYTH domain-containing protein [Cerasicoccus sp. TK19100]